MISVATVWFCFIVLSTQLVVLKCSASIEGGTECSSEHQSDDTECSTEREGDALPDDVSHLQIKMSAPPDSVSRSRVRDRASGADRASGKESRADSLAARSVSREKLTAKGEGGVPVVRARVDEMMKRRLPYFCNALDEFASFSVAWQALPRRVRLKMCQDAGFTDYLLPATVRKNRSCSGEVQLGDKVVYWIRHAQGQHNVLPFEEGGKIWDPEVTDAGKLQARQIRHDPVLSEAISDDPDKRVQLVVVSPLLRTMQTAILGLNSVLPNTTTRWILDPDLQETDPLPSSTGNPAKALQFLEHVPRPDLVEQYNELGSNWLMKNEGRYSASLVKVRQRFSDFTNWLQNRSEERVIVVSHGALMYHGLGDIYFDFAKPQKFILHRGQWCASIGP